VSKSRRPTRSRKAAVKRRRAAPARKARAAAPGRKVVTLKPLYEQLGRTIGQLQKLPPSDRVKLAIERLNNCRTDIEETCGPTMDVPADPTIPA
jgi:hypothetical protein